MPTALPAVDGWQPELGRHPLRLPGTRPLAFAGLAAGGLVAVALTAAVTLGGSSSGLEATARVAMVGVPIAVGLYAMRYAASARFGILLVLAGFGWFLATLSASSNPWIYSFGRVIGWSVEVSLIYLILAFPTGRLPERADRLLVALSAVLVAALYLPTAVLVEQYPLPSQWTDCNDACPANAFMLVAHEPAIVEDFVRPLRELLTIALFVFVTVRVAQRLRLASPLAKRALGPVLVVAIFRLAVFFCALTSRLVAPDSALTHAGVWLLALAVPLLALAFLVGVWHWRLFIADAMRRLAVRFHGRSRPDELQVAMAEEFGDPTLAIVRRVDDHPGRWVDLTGAEVPVPRPSPTSALTDIFDGNDRVAVIVHDPALSDDPTFDATAASYVLIALHHERLSAETARLAREVREERARVEAAASNERKRIEGDLHDGAQQRLVALGIRLELAAERTAAVDPSAAALLRELGVEVEVTLEELSSLARDGRPVALAERGLVEALRSAAQSSTAPVTVLANRVRRYSRELETAAYFCCLEAMQNATKHARDATFVIIELSDDDEALRLEVRDDGDGFDERSITPGAGLASMRGRIAAVGGVASIHSRPGHGTRVCARIPLTSPGSDDARSDRRT